MAKFMFLHRGGCDDGAQRSPEEMQQAMQAMGAWMQEGMKTGWLLDPGDGLKADGKTVHADFRGGVKEAFFVGMRVRWWPANETDYAAALPGRVVAYTAAASREEDPNVEVRFTKATAAQPGDVLTWDLKPSTIKGGRLHAPVCDDLAAMAAKP